MNNILENERERSFFKPAIDTGTIFSVYFLFPLGKSKRIGGKRKRLSKTSTEPVINIVVNDDSVGSALFGRQELYESSLSGTERLSPQRCVCILKNPLKT